MVPTPEEVLTLLEVAQLLKVAEKPVYMMAQKGELPAFKVQWQLRFKRPEHNRSVEQQNLASRDVGEGNE